MNDKVMEMLYFQNLKERNMNFEHVFERIIKFMKFIEMAISV